ncbi:MAG: Asp-tRNA(Asn)/Glu-tRNA(Gln) amidotransferase subunit GatC [bacterium]|nr:Asp-tRNA(Asn)/Glu-tRNA(Gln) amidotransferase subunit GatC [bacterium]
MISKEEVLKIAKLARLELTDVETEKMQKDLSGILDYFEVLKKAKGLPAQAGKSQKEKGKKEAANVLRKDEAVARPASLANNLVQAAPDKKDGYIKVKAIL